MDTFRVLAGINNMDVSVIVRVVDSADGTPETAVAFNTAGVDLKYRRDGAVPVAITEATLADGSAAHSDGGFVHLSDGYCRLDLPDAAVAAGVRNVLVTGTFTGMVVIGCKVEIIPFSEHGIVAVGTLQAGGTTSVTVASGQVPADDSWNGFTFMPTGGTGEGYAGRVIADSTALDVITFDTALPFTADGTTQYAIYATPPAGIQSSVEAGLTAYGASTATNVSAVETKVDTVDTVVDTLATTIGTPAVDIATDIADAETAIVAAIAALENLTAAEVNAEIVDALATDTYAQPAQGAPPATATLAVMWAHIYKAWRNKQTNDGTTVSIFADDGTTVDHKYPVSEVTGTVTRGEVVAGP